MMDELLIEYAKKFGEGFPTYQVLRTRTEKEAKKIVERCLKEGKDAYELGYASDDASRLC